MSTSRDFIASTLADALLPLFQRTMEDVVYETLDDRSVPTRADFKDLRDLVEWLCSATTGATVAWLATAAAVLAILVIAVFLIHKTVNKKHVNVGRGNGNGDDNDSGLSGDNVANADDPEATAAEADQDQLLPILRQLLTFCTLLGKVGSFRVGSVRAFRSIVKVGEQVTAGVGVGSFWLTCAVQWTFYARFVVVATLPAVVVVLCFVGVRAAFFQVGSRTFLRALTTRAHELVDPTARKI